MEVKKLDILESIVVGFVSFSYIKSIFVYAGTFPCILFAVGIAAIFLIFYHEKYIGVVLNIGSSLLWTVLLTTMISLFSVFRGRLPLLILIAVTIFYISLCIHGLSIHKLIAEKTSGFKTSDNVIQHPFNEFREEYSSFGKLKEQLLPVMSQILSDPNAEDGIKEIVSRYIISMDSMERVNEDFLKVSKKRRISMDEFKRIDGYVKQIKSLNRSLSEALSGLHNSTSNNENGHQHEQSHSDLTSYFNGCDSLESVKTRYRALCKVFHPDMGNGSAEEFDKIQKEYNIVKGRFS